MLKKYAFSVLLIVVLALVSFSSALAGAGVFPVKPLTPAPSAETGEKTFENRAITGIWWVELSGAPSINGNSLNTLTTQHETFRQQAQKAGIIYTERQSFQTLWNGFTVAADVSQVSKLRSLPGVLNVFPVQVIKMPETTTADPDLFTALTMTGADMVQSELGYTGAGIKVGIIDTGVDVNHPAFGGNGITENDSIFFFSSPRILYGYDFVGDDFNADDADPEIVPDPIPDDCAGHGTHVAGIVGANDSTNDMKGVAPDVILGAYRVFGCEGSTTDEVMLMAMEMAYDDGMQVINMSIGSPFDWPQAPTAVASTNLVNRGMVVVASIGNSGANGLYSAGAPGLGEQVIGVASFDNTATRLPYFEVNGNHIGYVTMTFSPAPPTSGTEEIVYIGRACNVDTLSADPSGKVALAVRGTCSFGEKALKAINAGATAVVIYNNTSGVVNGTLGASLGSPVPVVGISQADGLLIRAQSAPINMTWTDQLDSFTSPTGGLISSFSSYGLAPDLALKPDLGAPGGNIYSSYPLELGGYATLSGTSMSSPHVAGAAALFLQAHPTTMARDVRTYFQNNAEPADWWGYPGVGYLDNVNRQGAGMLRIDRAILATARVTPSKLSLGESQAGTASRALAITNFGSKAVTYRFSYLNALSVIGTFAPDFYESDAYVKFNMTKITIYPGSTKNVMAYIKPPTGPKLGQYGGYIVISGSDGSVMRVPYAGFIGNYQAIKAITPTGYGFPWLAVDFGGGNFGGPVTGPGDWVYTMEAGDVPYLLIHFDHQVTKLQVQVYKASTGALVERAYNYAFVETLLPRNSTSTGFYAFSWDGNLYMYNTVGTTFFHVAPDGQYILKLKALKALGNPAVASDWETWTSPVVEIDRPEP